MLFQFNDGGRAVAGFKGSANDCVTRAVAIVTGLPYAEVYAAINTLGKKEKITARKKGRSSARAGVYKSTTKEYLTSLGFKWVPTMFVGKGCTVHLKSDELPPGRLLVSISRHMVAVIDGVIHDTYDCSRCGTRCVYGYWQLVKD